MLLLKSETLLLLHGNKKINRAPGLPIWHGNWKINKESFDQQFQVKHTKN